MSFWVIGELVADVMLGGLTYGIRSVLGGVDEEPVYAMGRTVERVIEQVVPDATWDEADGFGYDAVNEEILVPDLSATDLESRVKAVHEAMHAKRHAAGEKFYETFPMDQSMDECSVKELWALFVEEHRVNRACRRWVNRRLGRTLLAAQVNAWTTSSTMKYFGLWAKRFFTGRWNGKTQERAQVREQLALAFDPNERLKKEAPEELKRESDDAKAGSPSMWRWLGSGLVVAALVPPTVTFARVAGLGLLAGKVGLGLMGLIGVWGCISLGAWMVKTLHN